MKFIHRWLGALAALVLILFAGSGIVLNHRSFFSPIDVPRNILPKTYQLKNWNFAAVRSACTIAPDSVMLFGNIGIWLTDENYSSFTPFYNGIKSGADNRRTSSILNTSGGHVLAGTMSGLYRLSGQKWEAVDLPAKSLRITGITQHESHIYVLTRSEIFRFSDTNPLAEPFRFQMVAPEGHTGETSLFRALWVIHSGEIFGLAGRLFVDIMGLALIFLCVSGLVWFFAPDLTRSVRNRLSAKKFIRQLNRFSFRWHNKLGIWMLAFLLISAATGIFLRPPLLIPIARKTFPAISHTILDHPNPWYDKLRDLRFDKISDSFIISTSDGFYYADTAFIKPPQRIAHQPPVSVMGINVFKQASDSTFIVGSFSGLYAWNPSERTIHDKITGLEVVPSRGMVNPFGAVAVAGYIPDGNPAPFIFDYTAGVFSKNLKTRFPDMPEEIRKATGLPLWNLALEVHTGRFYSFIFGQWYILFIPVAGLTYILILISGGILWLKRKRAKSSKPPLPINRGSGSSLD